MAGIKLEAFQGLIPRVSKRLLPPMAGQIARNTKILNGELRGFREPAFDSDLTALASSVKRAFRVPSGGGIQWLAFDSRDVSVSRSPLINDTFDRYYFAGASIGRPSMNTAARIASGDPPFFLGVPIPVSAPGVNPPAGADETRAYVYTFVSAYGEEGPPSPPTVAVGAIGTWNLTGMDTSVPDASQRNIATKKIYRTVAGNSSTSFFFVAEIPLAQATFADNITSQVVAANNLLESTTWVEPPASMEGFVVMPNGYLVGWVGKRLLFSEPYRPHAWPAAFELATEFDIVALGVFGSTLVIGTESQPYFGQGVTPASFTTQKIDAIEPCLSRRGMVSMTVGVLYPSINGLVLANSGGVQTVTQDLFTKEEWAEYNPANLYAAALGLQYMAFNSTGFAFLFDPQNPTSKFVELDAFTGVQGIETDHYSGNILLLINNAVYNWDPDVDTDTRVQWQWKSKTYQFPRPLNFGAARLNFETGSQSQQLPVLTIYVPYNESLFVGATALNTLNGGVLGGSPAQSIGIGTSPPNAEIRQPLGGSLLYPIQRLLFLGLSVRLIISIRGKVVFDTTVNSEKVLRLPTGFKSDIWEIEMNGNTTVYSLQLAETPKGLAAV